MSKSLEILKSWLIENQVSNDVLTEIELYARRNQVELLMKDILSLLENVKVGITWNIEIILSLQRCFTGLHFETSLKIWNEFIQYLKNLDASNNYCKEFSLTLWNYFLKNISVDNLPEKASIQIVAFLMDTQNICISTVQISMKEALVRCALELLRTTGELLLLFPSNSVSMSEWMKKTNCKLCNRTSDDFPHSFPDCSFIFPDLNLKLSMRLHKFCSKSSEDSLLFVAWTRILWLNLRWFCVMSNAKTLNYAQQLCDFLILHSLEKVTFDERNKTSDHAADFSLLYWGLTCNNFYSVVEFFSKFHELDRCKVHSINFAQKLIECMMSDHNAAKQLANEFFTNWQESGYGCMYHLHHYLPSILYEQISNMLTTSNQKKKLKKSVGDNQEVSTLFRLLIQPIEQLCNEDNQSRLASCVHKLLQNQILQDVSDIQLDYLPASSKINQFYSFIEILSEFTLPFMDEYEKFRGLLASLSLLCFCFQQQSTATPLIEQCFNILHIACLDNKCVYLLFKIIDPSMLFNWILHCHEHFNKMPYYQNLLEKLFKSLMTHALKSSKTINQLAEFVGKLETSVNKNDGNQHSALETLVWTCSLIDKALMQHYVKKDCLALLKRLKFRLLNEASPRTHQFYQKITELETGKDKTKKRNSAKNNNNDDSMVVDDEYITYFQILACFIRQRKIKKIKFQNEKEIFKGDGDDDDDDGVGYGDIADKEDDNEEFMLFGAKELLAFFKCAINNIKSSKNAQVVSSSVVLVREVISGFRDESAVLQQSLQKEDNRQDKTFMGLNLCKYLMTVWEITTAKLKLEISNIRKINSSCSVISSSIAEKKQVHQQFSKNQNQKNNAADLIDLGSLLLCVLFQDQLDVALKEIFEALEPSITSPSPEWIDVECYLLIWQQLFQISSHWSNSHLESIFYFTSQRILISITTLLQNCAEPALSTLMLNILTTYIGQGQDFLTSQDVSLLFHATSTVDLELYPTKLTTKINVIEHISNFLDLFKAYHSVLNALLSHHTNSVYSMIPNFMYGVKKLLQACMWAGQQSQFTLGPSQLNQIEMSALLVARLANLMSEHKLNFNKVVHYVVAEFVDCLQRVVLYPSIKKALLQAIYRWLDMCNEYTTSQLQSTLSPGAREIFKSLYSDYQNYHKLKGKN